MRRFVFLAVLCGFILPVTMSLSGCYVKDYGQNFCSGFQSGPSSSATSTIDLEPRTYGVSVNYGATNEVVTPTAYTCKGVRSGLTTFVYGSSDLTIADVSPSGQLCGGTWNRSTGNGVPNFTTCIPTNKTGVAYVTASGGGATSNPVAVYVHPNVTSVVLGATSQQGCISQNHTTQLNATVFSNATDITADAGHLVYSPQNSNIVTIDQNGVATAHQPGSTVISANVAQASSTAGYFFTCPPANIALTVGNTGNTSVTINPTNIQPLTATVTDTQGNSINGLALTYSSTNPINIAVNNTGVITSNFPSDADVVVQCLPGVCNPAPQDQVGLFGTGLPITSNPVAVQTPGPSSTILYLSNPLSYGFVPIDFLTGTVGRPVTLPYLPNSMVMDQLGDTLYFGSATELMVVSTATNSLVNQVPGIQGTVLAVSPDNATVVVHDPCRQLFYLYTPAQGKTSTSPGASSVTLTFPAPGPAIACNANNQPIYTNGAINPVYSTAVPGGEVNPPYAATFTEDSQNLYITYSNPPGANTPNPATLFVYSRFTGFHTCTDNGQPLATNCPVSSPATSTTPVPSAAVTVPGVGLYTSTTGGTAVTAFDYCAQGPNNTGTNPNTAVNPTNYYPPVGSVFEPVDQLTSTTNGTHILGATAATGNITDIDVTIPAVACPKTGSLQFGPPPNVAGTPYVTALGATGIAAINQVLASPNSALAFVTYYSTTPAASNNTILPAYKIPATGAGQVVPITLAGTAGAPIAGVFSPDTNTFYVSTDQDNLIHLINTNTLTDIQTLNPVMTSTTGQIVPAFFMAAKPRPVQGTTTATAKAN